MLNAASGSQSSIDKKMAEVMNNEKKDFYDPDNIMVPSTKSPTGWKIIKKDQLERIRSHRTKNLPGLQGALKARPIE